MFFNRDIFLQNATKNKALFEYTFTELKNNSDEDRRARAKGITTHFQGIEQGPDGQARAIFRVPSQTDRSKNYNVTVAIIVPKSSLFAVAKAKWDPTKFANTLKNANVKVHCTCMDFLMAGPKYNLGPSGKYKGSVLTDKTQPSYKTINPTAPDYTDPQRRHILCKHCIAVATNFTANSFNIMKSVRKFTVEVSADPKKTADMDNGKKPLKKDIELVDLDQEKANKITEGLVHGGEMVQEEESKLNKDNQTPKEQDQEVDTVVEEKPTPEIKPIEQPPEEVEVPQVTEKKPEMTVPELDKNKEETEETKTMDSDLNPVEKPENEVPLEKDKEETNEEDTRDANELVGKPKGNEQQLTKQQQPADLTYNRTKTI